ncbi:hypothetical protein EPTV-WA-021 [Eptesipox virus]|uniref:Uncharacterized protein n=1 Tax=Eptesipox virus TaxID=1329402 RepID=A0A220T691_9POXV|nr:hypothetical protein CG743_gp021 [Eptesipox virus]ASK51222.1 hypothetical protein EPTV-WA-021 [Eptesipox virus]WAH70980.1 hypothetical protein CG743_gp021 [Eptesipox virus]
MSKILKFLKRIFNTESYKEEKKILYKDNNYYVNYACDSSLESLYDYEYEWYKKCNYTKLNSKKNYVKKMKYN